MSGVNSAFQTESTAALAGAGVATGLARSAGESPSDFVYFVAESFADQAGTLFVEKSNDGATWYPCNGTAGTTAAINTTTTVAPRVTARYYRARYVNGATPNTVFQLMTAFTTA